MTSGAVAQDDAAVLRSAAVPRSERRTIAFGFGAVTAFAVACGIAKAAVAAEPAEVEDLIRKGVELRRDHKDQLALPLFKKAYELAHTPRTAAQLGLVEMSLGYTLEAERHLVEGLAAPRDVWIRRNKAVLDGALSRVRAAIGEVVIEGHPADAEVWLNGKQVGALPLANPIRVPEGSVTIELRAPGHVTLARTIKVIGGGTERVTMELPVVPSVADRPSSLPSLPSALAPPSSPPSASDQMTAHETRDTAPGTISRTDRRTGIWSAAWVSAGASVVGLGFAIVQTTIWQRRVGEFDDNIGPQPSDPSIDTHPNCGTGERYRGGPGCSALYDP
jgi:hypothetical protein